MDKAIGIVGGGVMGCLAALALAREGYRVTIFEREKSLMSRASTTNEGKIHYGFTYGLDPTGQTQSLMLRYGLRFRRHLEDILGQSIAGAFTNHRGIYAVERDSFLDPQGIRAHLDHIERDYRRQAQSGEVEPLDGAMVRELGDDERDALFSDLVIAAYDLAEPYVDPARLCSMIAAAIAAEPRIELRFGAEVSGILAGDEPRIVTRNAAAGEGFDSVINAAWDGMPRLAGERDPSATPFCLRAKCGFHTRIVAGMPDHAVTFVWGPYGDIVPVAPDTVYFSWYPDCLMGFSTDVAKGSDWYDERAAGFDFHRAYERGAAAIGRLMPGVEFAPGPESIHAGPILAFSHSDIHDRASGLHRRDRFGISRRGRVFDVNTGKFTCAPLLASEVVAAVLA